MAASGSQLETVQDGTEDEPLNLGECGSIASSEDQAVSQGSTRLPSGSQAEGNHSESPTETQRTKGTPKKTVVIWQAEDSDVRITECAVSSRCSTRVTPGVPAVRSAVGGYRGLSTAKIRSASPYLKVLVCLGAINIS